jgi:hypothetical protein
MEDYCLSKEELKSLESENENDVAHWCLVWLKRIPRTVYHPSGYILYEQTKMFG